MKKNELPDIRPLPPLMVILGYGGLGPFVLLSVMMLHAAFVGPGLQSSSVFGLYTPYLFISYSAIILSFLSGTLWSRNGYAPESTQNEFLLLGSNLLALTAWLALILVYFSSVMTLLAVSLLIAGFASVLLFERSIMITNKSYWRLRLYLTGTVIATQLLVLFLLIEDL